MHQFDEHHRELKGFSKVFDQDIFPILAETDSLRKKALKDSVAGVGGVASLAAIIAFILSRFDVEASAYMILAAFSVFIAMAVARWMQKSIRLDTKTRIMTSICEYVGWNFKAEFDGSMRIPILIENGLLPRSFDRSKYEDHIWGDAHGASFDSFEAHLEEKRNSGKSSHWVTVFRGSIMTIDFHRDFLGRTVVLRDKGFFNRKKKAGMKKVGLVDPVFEKIFEAYGTDQVEARYLLAPDFMQQLVDLETSVDGKNIRFAFLDQKLIIAVETPNRFEAGSMLKPLTDPARTQKILNEIGAVYDVIDGVLKPLNRRNA